MENQRFAVIEQVRKQLFESRRVVQHKGPVGVFHQNHRVLRREPLAGVHQALHALHDRRLNRQRVHLCSRYGTGQLRSLCDTAKVAHARQAQAQQQGLVIGAQGGKVVRAKQPTPTHGSPVLPGVAA